VGLETKTLRVIVKMEKGDKTYLSKGVAPILLSAAIWGGGYFVRKLIINDISPYLMAFLTAIIVSVYIFCTGNIKLRDVYHTYKCNIWKYTALAFSGVTMASALMYVGLDKMDLGIASLLVKLEPIFTLIMAQLFLGERWPRKWILYAFLCVISSCFVVVQDPSRLDLNNVSLVGVLAVIGAAFFWAIAGVLGKAISNTNVKTDEIVFIRFTLGGVLMIPLFLMPVDLGHHFNPTVRSITLLLIVAIISTGIAFRLYYNGLKYVSAGTSSLLELVTPITSILLGVVFLGEIYSVSQIIASCALLFGIYKLSTVNDQPALKSPTAASFSNK